MGSWEMATREGSTAAMTMPTSSLIPATEGKGIVRLDKESILGRAYLELWSKATPDKPLAADEAGGMTSAVEMRRVPWRNVRASELPIRHGQVIVLGEKLLMFWLQDDALYLLQTSKMQRENTS
jgi:hypothetical protein